MNADQRIAEWLTEGAAIDESDPDAESGGEVDSPATPASPSRASRASAFPGRSATAGSEASEAAAGRTVALPSRLRGLPAALGFETQEARVLELADAVGRNIRRRPLTALALSIGAGFVIGGALSSRAGRILLAAGARHVARELLKQLL